MEISGESYLSEADAVRRAGLGDGAAWEVLVRLHQEAVFRFAYLLLGDPDEAEDVAQETFIRAYRAFSSFDTARAIRPWLLSITANLASNRRRSLGRYFTALNRLFYADPPQKAVLEDKSAEDEANRAVWQAIHRLNGADCQVIYLRYFLEMPVEEVSDVIGVAAGTVKSRLHRALKRLREVFEREYPDLWKDWNDG